MTDTFNARKKWNVTKENHFAVISRRSPLHSASSFGHKESNLNKRSWFFWSFFEFLSEDFDEKLTLVLAPNTYQWQTSMSWPRDKHSPLSSLHKVTSIIILWLLKSGLKIWSRTSSVLDEEGRHLTTQTRWLRTTGHIRHLVPATPTWVMCLCPFDVLPGLCPCSSSVYNKCVSLGCAPSGKVNKVLIYKKNKTTM